MERNGEKRFRALVHGLPVRSDENGAGIEFEPIVPVPDAADFVFIGEFRALKGIQVLLEALGPPPVLVVMEATGHYWKNLFAALTAKGFKVALVNPLRTNRFAASSSNTPDFEKTAKKKA